MQFAFFISFFTLAVAQNTYAPHTESTPSSEIEDLLGVKCNFETPCAWAWTENLSDGFQVISGTELAKKNMTGLMPGPVADNIDDANGHFLYARVQPTTRQLNLTSPSFSTTLEKCFLEVYMHQSDMSHGLSRVVVEPLHPQESSWVPAEIQGDNFRTWQHRLFRLGRISRDFRIVFEIVPELQPGQKAHVALDNLRMVNCFPEGTKSEKCSTSQVKCMMNKVPVCIPLPRICDITRDCDDAEDEQQSCGKFPAPFPPYSTMRKFTKFIVAINIISLLQTRYPLVAAVTLRMTGVAGATQARPR